MTGIYILVVIILNVVEKVPQAVEGVNTVINANLSGEKMFWIGFLIAVVLDMIFD